MENCKRGEYGAACDETVCQGENYFFLPGPFLGESGALATQVAGQSKYAAGVDCTMYLMKSIDGNIASSAATDATFIQVRLCPALPSLAYVF